MVMRLGGPLSEDRSQKKTLEQSKFKRDRSKQVQRSNGGLWSTLEVAGREPNTGHVVCVVL